jgi:repressor LexA
MLVVEPVRRYFIGLTRFIQIYTILIIMESQETISKQMQAVRYIRNQLVHFGRSPSIRELQIALGYKWPRSAALILSSLISKGILKRGSAGELRLIKDPEEDKSHARTVDVPLVGRIACGAPILAEGNIEAVVPVSKGFIRPGCRYFLLRAKGDSMIGAGIKGGDFVLVQQQATAKNGDIVVALIDDEATLKEFQRSGDAVILKPHNKKYQPIILRNDFQVQGVVVAKGLDLR